jgi:hypothetical protein
MQPKFVTVKILIQYCRYLNSRKVDCIITTPQHPPHPPVRKPSCNHTHKTRNAVGEIILIIIASGLWWHFKVFGLFLNQEKFVHCTAVAVCRFVTAVMFSCNKMLRHICHDLVSPVAHSSFVYLVNYLHFKYSFWILLIPHSWKTNFTLSLLFIMAAKRTLIFFLKIIPKFAFMLWHSYRTNSTR